MEKDAAFYLRGSQKTLEDFVKEHHLQLESTAGQYCLPNATCGDDKNSTMKVDSYASIGELFTEAGQGGAGAQVESDNLFDSHTDRHKPVNDSR